MKEKTLEEKLKEISKKILAIREGRFKREFYHEKIGDLTIVRYKEWIEEN